MKLMRIKIKKSLLTLTRSYQWTDKMVYILAANKYLKLSQVQQWSITNHLHRYH